MDGGLDGLTEEWIDGRRIGWTDGGMGSWMCEQE
jgi:hypothetical protein